MSFSRGLYGKPRNDAFTEDLLTRLSLLDKRKTIMMHLSGGMKRRVMIAKALSHEPAILFLDEPTAGVDVELRRDMWDWSANSAPMEQRSSSPRIISRKPRKWPTASESSARAS